MDRKEFFNRHSKEWDGHQTATPEQVKKIVPMFKVAPGSSVLDAGSGTGILLPYLREAAGKGAKITALDISDDMLKKAREKFGAQFEYALESIEEMSFKDFSFDRVICFSCFPHVVDKQKAFREAFRVLRKGGMMFVAHACSREHINTFHHGIEGPVKGDRLPENSAMERMFKNAGFTDVEILNTDTHYIASGIKPA
jgi:ubiquinone/menaquinone biosynthesis C-methylase UbiE